MGIDYLLDTHILLWWLFDAPELSDRTRKAIANRSNTIWISAATAWEIATKYRIRKLPEATEIVANYPQLLQQAGFVELTIKTEHALYAGQMAIDHRDPFDRMLLAQAEIEGMVLISADSIILREATVATLPN
ncbi:MAG: type II toxin-antitoxin system VapC family toxin [Gammaproteobacteria bacterium]|nr:type II toxin-antitoxin system VapC family toxin [Gammaproteobacteria bacterium]